MYWKYLIPTVLMVVSIPPTYGQSKDAVIKNIRVLFRSINSDSTLKTIELSEEEFLDVSEGGTDGGATLKGYFKGDSLVKMHLWVGLSLCVRQYDYYFAGGRPFFIYETEEDFPIDSSGPVDRTKLKLAFEGRYYLDHGKVIDIKTKGEKKADEMPSNPSVLKLVADSKDYIKALRKHLKKATLLSLYR
jgi:hypothetical protein